MENKNWLVCPNCNYVIGKYDEIVEKHRLRQGFPSYCKICKMGVKPKYI